MSGADWRKVAIIAGGGALPRDLAAAMARAGKPHFVIAVRGACGDWVRGYPHRELAMGQIGALFETIAAEGCDAVAFAGSMGRPSAGGLRFDWGGVKVAPRILRLLGQGDDALLRGVAQIFEEKGVAVAAPQAYLTELLAAAGAMTKTPPHAEAAAEARFAARMVAALGPYDVGQAVVVAGGRCLAIEAAEGTQAMLERVAALHPSRRGDRPSGLLFKAPKPGQDPRFDLPAIGPDTIAQAAAAGLRGVAVAAGEVFLLDRAETLARAEAAGLYVLGVSCDEVGVE